MLKGIEGRTAVITGAASGIATKYMAKPEAETMGVVGSGRQARTQVEAICAVRPIKSVKVYSPTQANREKFCRDIAEQFKVEATAVDEAEHAVRESEIVVSATTAEEPVVCGRWLRRGAHINAVGANYEHRRELDRDAVLAAATIATDDLEQVRYESTDLAIPVKHGTLSWDRIVSLGDIVAGKRAAREYLTDMTLFKSLGVAIEDVALAARAYEKALATGVVNAFMSSGATGYDSKVWETLTHFYDTRAWIPRNVTFVNKAAFDAKSVADALRAYGGGAPTASDAVTLTAPDIAENGAVVPLGASTSLPTWPA